MQNDINKINAILFLVNPSDRDFYEMTSLMDTAGYSTILIDKQKIDTINKSFYIGSGKIDDLDIKISLNDEVFREETVIIFNVDLSQTQSRNISEKLKMEVIDRTSLILEIFEMNARTLEAKTQVEIAKLKRLSAQLVNEKADYAQVTSGRGHNKGSGEKQKELSRREIQNQISQYEKQLNKIKLSRQNTRKKRNESGIVNISVVGYTNAGKSTLINSLVSYSKKKPSKNVLVKDQLFATLETYSRLINVYNYPSFVITDTVGFISNLPHFLVRAFLSTLEVIKDSDYLIEVIDSSSKYYNEERETTEAVLSALGANEIPRIVIYNKIDKSKYQNELVTENEIYTSLKNKNSIESVHKFIIKNITKNWEKHELLVPYDVDIFSFCKYNYIIEIENKNDAYHITAQINPLFIDKYKPYFLN